MTHWAISLYLISGIVMAIGVYFTIQYRPYCTLKSPEREIAMELHRKKLYDESLKGAEIQSYNNIKFQTKCFSIGNFMTIMGSLLHIFIFVGNSWYLLSPIYFLSSACIALLFVVKTYFLPYCFQRFPAIILWDMKSEYLLPLNAYWKKFNNEKLEEDEVKQIKYEESKLKMFEFYRNCTNLGVVLHLFLDVWFGLNGSLTIN